MNKKIIATLIIGTALGAGGNYYLQQRPTPVTLIKPQSSQLQSTILATGQVKTRTSSTIHSEGAGLVNFLAEEGQTLGKNQPLAIIEDKEAASIYQQAQANLHSAQLKLTRLSQIERKQTKLKVEQAQILVTQAQRQLSNIQSLTQQQLASQDALHLAQETLALRQKDLATALLQQQAVAEKGLEEQTALSQQQAAQAQLTQANIRQQRQTILSAFDVIVLERKANLAQYVKQGDPLLTVAALKQQELIARVDERWLPQLHLQQSATVIADAFPQQAFSAYITHIAPSVNDTRGTLEIRLTSQQWPNFLKEGMTVSIELLSQSQQQTIVIPSRLVQQTENQYWVWVAKNNQAQRQNIRVGLRHLDQTQVLDGIDSKTQLIDSKMPLQIKQKIRIQGQ